MTARERSLASRAAALGVLVLVLAAIWLGPAAIYQAWRDDAAAKRAAAEALLARDRAILARAPVRAGESAAAILFPASSDAQGAALLQETLKAAALAAKVEIEGLQVLPPDTLAGSARIAVRVSARGDIAGLERLLYAIEASRPLLYPDVLAVAARTSGTALDFQLEVSAFRAGAPS